MRSLCGFLPHGRDQPGISFRLTQGRTCEEVSDHLPQVLISFPFDDFRFAAF